MRNSPKPEIVLATHNRHKLSELRALITSSGVRVLSLDDFPGVRPVREDGRTFEANARKKARAYSAVTGMLTLADDSGLSVRCLRGRPGVYSARFAGKGCSYSDNNRKLLRLMEHVPASKRQAKFICVMALYDAGKPVGVVRGECGGRIIAGSRGARGFGYDPVFIPNGRTRTFAEMSPVQKGNLSHRGRALRRARSRILRYFTE